MKLPPLQVKLAKCLLVAGCTILPWNATAVSQGYLPSKLFSSKSEKNLVEKQLVESLVQIAQGHNKEALATVDELIRTTPNFKLAHLIRGDLLSAQANALSAFGNSGLFKTKSDTAKIEDLRAEARTRVDHYFSADNARQVPNIAVQMNAKQQNLILIDTAKSRLFLYEKSGTGLQYVADYYVSIGRNGADKNVEGDKRTPVGLYFSSKKLETPLSDFYGDGAYPLSYPNELDVHQKKTGYGIWLHGTPKDTYSRPPLASDGCVVVSNPDLNKLAPALKTGNIPVIISGDLKWVDSQQSSTKNAELQSLNKALNSWRADWASQNTNKYLNHYSKNFFYKGGELTQWENHKRRVQANKPKVKIEVSDVSMFSYPKTGKIKNQKIYVVEFDQHYKSPTLKNEMRKRQYWQYENKQWKIIYEGAA